MSASHDGTTTGTAWSGESNAGPYLIPNIAITQALNERMTMGLGLGVVAGVGSDFRKVPGSLDPLAEILVLGANAGMAYQVNDRLSIGGMATIGMGLGQADSTGNGIYQQFLVSWNPGSQLQHGCYNKWDCITDHPWRSNMKTWFSTVQVHSIVRPLNSLKKSASVLPMRVWRMESCL